MKHKTSERPPADTSTPITADWLDVVKRKVDGLRFGSIQIIVHEGRVTQVESLEKTRFPASRDEPASLA